jgi:aryl-alcohol dehydrogenase-like predicted oxidoreductase
MKRRDFLGVAAAGAGALTASTLSASTEITRSKPPKPVSKDPLAMIPLTKDIQCSRIGLGTGMRGGGRVSDMVRAGWPKSIEVLQYAYDRGVRMFDLADMYGTHVIVREALRNKPRDSYTLVTKLWLHPDRGLPERERLRPEETLPRLLRELGTDYIDIVQLHGMDSGTWTTDFEDAMASLEELKKKGDIRAHGISSHSSLGTAQALKSSWCDVAHICINSEGIRVDNVRAQPDPAIRIQETIKVTKQAHEAGIGTIAMKILGQGNDGMNESPERRKKSTTFVTQLDCFDVLIASFSENEHVDEFINNVAEALA